MRLADATAEGARVMAVCNACRYCEQYCPVFQAMSRENVEFKIPANCPSSFSASSAGMRCERSPAEIFVAVSLISRIGRIARVAIHQPPASPTSSTPLPAINSNQPRRCSSATSELTSNPVTTASPGGVKVMNSRKFPRTRMTLFEPTRSGIAIPSGAESDFISTRPSR
jgi:hypothetical protein